MPGDAAPILLASASADAHRDSRARAAGVPAAPAGTIAATESASASASVIEDDDDHRQLLLLVGAAGRPRTGDCDRA